MKIVRSLALLAAVPLAVGIAGCSAPAASDDASAGGADVQRVALVLGTVANDGGFAQYAADAVHALEDEGLVEVQITESVVNPADAEPLFRQYAAEGYDLIIGWGLGFSESVFKVAKELPETHFIATGANNILDQATDNVETWTYNFAEYGYLEGWVAGKAELDTWGIVDAELAPYNEPMFDAFRIGIAETNPDATEVEPIFTGSFDDTQLANQAAKAQISQGANLILGSSGANNQGIIAAAVEAGIGTIGLANNASDDAAKVNLGVVDLNWEPTLRQIVQHLQDGEFGNTGYISEIANNGLVFSANAVSIAPAFPTDIEEQAKELARQLADGEIELPDLS